ncbi:MAG: hypothetical protein NVS4B5_17750 [Vulcanimicrobiaceae bacterium]
MTPFILFVCDASAHSRAAIGNLNAILRLLGHSPASVEIANIDDEIELALEYRVMVTPTLLRRDRPTTRLIGDLSAHAQLERFLADAEQPLDKRLS